MGVTPGVGLFAAIFSFLDKKEKDFCCNPSRKLHKGSELIGKYSLKFSYFTVLQQLPQKDFTARKVAWNKKHKEPKQKRPDR
ncbi:hypothetical protein FK004_03095 [Flavobacterium kingsejongi]|uniref:Uncharacterized protein n=1 Tax=Flavobacterium kingsejongi TaxID=1678728 RepID=A0A2S1LKI2_9FLAO|nr:hypothetical protein FK004_03095 [Flavobacterium kingsejongi]